MELLNELGNDLALAFLSENRSELKIDRRQVVTLIAQIKETLKPIERSRRAAVGGFFQPEPPRQPDGAGDFGSPTAFRRMRI